MNTNRLVRLGAVLFALSVAGWILYVPSFTRNPLRAVPAFAQIVYSSSKPDWSVLERIPFARHWENGDAVPAELKNAPLVLAVAPLSGRDRRDAWIAVSAVGPRSVLLRWRLILSPPPSIRRLHSYCAWPVWQVEDPSLPPWMRIRFSITDGLLICAVSDNSHDIYTLLDVVDGRSPSKAQRKGTQ